MIFIAITGTSAVPPGAAGDASTRARASRSAATRCATTASRSSDTPHVAYLMANIGVLRRRQADRHAASRRSASTRSPSSRPPRSRSARRWAPTSTWCSAATTTRRKMATILAYLNPLIGFLYWGGIVLALGTVGGRSGRRRCAAREPAYAPAPAARGGARGLMRASCSRCWCVVCSPRGAGRRRRADRSRSSRSRSPASAAAA